MIGPNYFLNASVNPNTLITLKIGQFLSLGEFFPLCKVVDLMLRLYVAAKVIRQHMLFIA